MRVSVLFVTFLFFVLSPLLAKKRPRTGKESLFGKEYATYQITSNELSGACFYLVSGHGGPDPGAIGIYQGRQLHEDEYTILFCGWHVSCCHAVRRYILSFKIRRMVFVTVMSWQTVSVKLAWETLFP